MLEPTVTVRMKEDSPWFAPRRCVAAFFRKKERGGVL
jgi:hypothetical protein